MNQFFGTQYSQEDLQQRLAQKRNRDGAQRTSSMSMAPPTSQGGDNNMDMTGMMGGDTLDDIIMQNNREAQRRQSIPDPYSGPEVDRRSSLMEFGAANNDLSGFQFAPTSTAGNPSLRRQSTGELDMTGYTDIGSGASMQAPQMGFASSMQTSESLTIDTSSFPGMSTDMIQGMMGYAPFGMEGISDDNSVMNMFSPTDFTQSFSTNMDPVASNFMVSGPGQSGLPSHRGSIHGDASENDNMIPDMSGVRVSSGSLVSSPVNMSMNQSLNDYHSPVNASIIPMAKTRESTYSIPTAAPTPAPPQELEVVQVPKVEPEESPYKNIYSQSGFDMLGALLKVASRKNPEVNLGKVDLSCAFVVCDVTQHDCPIIYVSEVFERLTGYTKYEVLGRNCRFLQSPDGKIQQGEQRAFSNHDSVLYLRNRIAARREAQRNLINYRKGGMPFINLLSMIPITGDDDKEIQYYVGFQVDLVAKPASLESKGANGMYTIDYSQGELPQYIWQPPEGLRSAGESGQTVSVDDVSTLLNSISNKTESELTKRLWDKVLLENSDDVVHVLSLKGLFLYLSPSCRKILEYDPSELVGTALSSVCHPSDIVPVTRELKDTITGVAVSVVYRIRRKKSGYTWFESYGSLCVEQGKGRKCLILVGRERPVYALTRSDIDAAGGIGENEMWTKLSTSGMFLHVSSNVKTLLDRSPDDLIGTSIQALMRAESKRNFGRSLEKARTGKRATYKHEVLNRRGLVLQAQTTLYPGDASEGSKPTFLVGQTRLLKTSSRVVAPAMRSQDSSKSMGSIRKEQVSNGSPRLSHQSETSSQFRHEGENTPRSTESLPGPVTSAGGAGLPIGTQDMALASEDNIFDELKTTRCTSWQFELRQMERSNRLLTEELAALLQNKKKRKRRKGAGHMQRDCANCHTRVTPEWRRGPSGQRDLCNSCGLRWAKQVSRSNSDQSGNIRHHTKGRSQSDSSTSRS